MIYHVNDFQSKHCHMQIEHVFLSDPVCNVVKLNKTMLYMGKMEHNISYYLSFACANSVNWWENDEKRIINGISVQNEQNNAFILEMTLIFVEKEYKGTLFIR